MTIRNNNFEAQLSKMLSSQKRIPFFSVVDLCYKNMLKTLFFPLLYTSLYNTLDFASWPVKPKILTSWSFTEKVCYPLVEETLEECDTDGVCHFAS